MRFSEDDEVSVLHKTDQEGSFPIMSFGGAGEESLRVPAASSHIARILLWCVGLVIVFWGAVRRGRGTWSTTLPIGVAPMTFLWPEGDGGAIGAPVAVTPSRDRFAVRSKRTSSRTRGGVVASFVQVVVAVGGVCVVVVATVSECGWSGGRSRVRLAPKGASGGSRVGRRKRRELRSVVSGKVREVVRGGRGVHHPRGEEKCDNEACI